MYIMYIFNRIVPTLMIPMTSHYSPNIYKEAGKLIVHYASVAVSGQNQQFVMVCSMFRHFVSRTLVAPSGKQGNYHSSLQSCKVVPTKKYRGGRQRPSIWLISLNY